MPRSERTFPPRVIETACLRLRLPRLDDADAVYAYAADPEVTHHLAFATHQSIDDAKDFLTRSLTAWSEGSGHRPWVIETRDGGAVLGTLGFDVHGHRVNVGYVLARQHWGKGYMSEALAAVRDAAFADAGIHRLEAFHQVANRASGRVMEKVGMQREGVLRSYLVHPQQGDEPQDAVMWAIVRGDLAP